MDRASRRARILRVSTDGAYSMKKTSNYYPSMGIDLCIKARTNSASRSLDAILGSMQSYNRWITGDDVPGLMRVQGGGRVSILI